MADNQIFMPLGDRMPLYFGNFCIITGNIYILVHDIGTTGRRTGQCA